MTAAGERVRSAAAPAAAVPTAGKGGRSLFDIANAKEFPRLLVGAPAADAAANAAPPALPAAPVRPVSMPVRGVWGSAC